MTPEQRDPYNMAHENKIYSKCILTLLVPGCFGSKISRGGGQFDPGFYFELWTPKMGAMAILVYSMMNITTNAKF